MQQSFIRRTHLLQYSLLALPLAFAGLPLYIHMPDFYVANFGLGLSAIGSVLLLVRLFDAFQDPLIGYLSDQFANLRQQILMIGLAALSLGLFALFWGPQWTIPAIIWFGISMLLATSGFSLVVININMIGGFWSANQYERTRIATWRESLTLVGLLTASILPSILMAYYSATAAFKLMSLVYVLLVLIAGAMFWHNLARVKLKQHVKPVVMPVKALMLLLSDRQGLFFFIYLLVQLAASFPAVLVIFFVRDYLQAESYTGLFLCLYFLAGSLLLPIWLYLSKIINQYRTWLVAMVLSIAVFAWVLMLSPGDVWAYGVICVLSGFALGADLSLPAAIVADRVSAIQAESRATLYYGVMAFIPKFALALASGFAFWLLAQNGFAANASNSDISLKTLLMLYALMPCLIKVFAAIFLWMLIKEQGKDNPNEQNRFIEKRSHHHGLNDVS